MATEERKRKQRTRILARRKKKLKTDPGFRAKWRAKQYERYKRRAANDPDYRWAQLALIGARKRKKYKVRIDAAYLRCLREKQDNRCALSGVLFDGEIKPSLDRIDNTKGYIDGNVRLITVALNYAKATMTDEQFIAMCRAVVDYADHHSPMAKGASSRQMEGEA